MVNRDFWLKAVETAWKERSVLWLAGVRRTGKTCLAQALPDTDYFDCELPRVRQLIEPDPEGFLKQHAGGGLCWTKSIASGIPPRS